VAAPSVSVIIPCFNAAAFLAAAVDSILQQRAGATAGSIALSIEILVVDDGSTDASPSLAKSFGPAVRLLRQTNAGISAARNAGVAVAGGEFLAFLDADDLWTAGSLAARMRLLQASPPTDAVFGQCEQFFDAALDPLACGRWRVDLRRQPFRHPGAMLIRRPAFDRVGGFATGLQVGEMVEWLGRAQAAGVSFENIDDLVLRRRIHGGNTSLRADLRKHDVLRALKQSIDARRAAGAPPGIPPVIP
jgi:glycosyltransferase involved in cell wall biosynthesis